VKFTTKKGSQTYQTFPTANLTGSLVVSSSFSGILGKSTPLQLGNWFKDRGLQPSFAQLAAFTLTAAQLKDAERWLVIRSGVILCFTTQYMGVAGGCQKWGYSWMVENGKSD
jgi:hypothetical protein